MAQKTLDPHMWNLETLFELIYEVPVYQRPYSWDGEQVEVLLDDIWDAFVSDDWEDGYYTGMDYDTFMSQILNKIGNLRIYYRDKNSRRQNIAIALKKYDLFHTYSNIKPGEKMWLI